MRIPHSPETIARCRALVETTVRSHEDIAAEIGTSEPTVRRWIRAHGWRRPEGLAPDRRKIPADKYEVVWRLYTGGASSADLAALLRCSLSHVDKVAAREGWTRAPRADAPPAGPAPGGALSGALAEIEAALRAPDLARRDFLRLFDRAMALTAADALAGAAGVERAAQILTRLTGAAKSMPDDAPPAGAAPQADAAADPFPDANDLIEEIARRFQAFSDEHLDPRLLALLAETVP